MMSSFALTIVTITVPLMAQQSYGERIEVNITNVDVVVTDRSGAHVRGLTKDDFEVLDGGALQAVTNFSEIRGGTAAEATVAATGTTTDPSASAAPKRPVNLLLFVDNQHLQAKTRARAAEALQKFLAAHQDDAVRALALRFNGGHNSRPLTGDAASVAKELTAFLDAEPPKQVNLQGERRHLQELIEGSRDPDQAFGYAVTWASSVRNDNVRTLEGLQSAIAAMSGLEGRKVLLFVTEGIPQRAGAELFRHWADRFRKNADLQSMEFDMSKQLAAVARFANACGVSLYTLNVTGTATDSFEINSGLTLRDADELRSSRQATLDFLAEQTGGTAIRNQNVFDAPLAAVADDFHDYYSLAYRTPPGKTPAHKIEVRVKRPGLRVRTPREYAVQTADQKVRAQVDAMFIMPPHDANPLAVVIARKEARDAGSGTRVVPFLIRISRDKLTTVTGGHVTLFLAVMDSEGARSPTRTLGLDVPKEGDVMEELQLTLRKGSQTVVAGARDDVSGTLSLVRVEVAND
jgi:VWFA-related protein